MEIIDPGEKETFATILFFQLPNARKQALIDADALYETSWLDFIRHEEFPHCSGLSRSIPSELSLLTSLSILVPGKLFWCTRYRLELWLVSWKRFSWLSGWIENEGWIRCLILWDRSKSTIKHEKVLNLTCIFDRNHGHDDMKTDNWRVLFPVSWACWRLWSGSLFVS